MDPLGITASVITVLQATHAILSVCYDYSSAVGNSSWELRRVTKEVKSLRDVLETLEKLAEGAGPAAETQLPTLKRLCEPKEGHLAMCLVELKTLEKKLAPLSCTEQAGSKRRAIIQALGWPLREGDTKKTLKNISRFRAILNLAITADQT